jgi:hypothetical protein
MQDGDEARVLLQAIAWQTFCRLPIVVFNDIWKRDFGDYRKESSIFRFTLILYYVLTNLQFALKFVCPFIIGEGAFCSNKVENLIVVIIVISVSPNQLNIPYYAFHIRSTLNQKIPLVLYPAVHLFLSGSSPHSPKSQDQGPKACV